MNLKQLDHLVTTSQLISSIQQVPSWNDDPPFSKFVTTFNGLKYDGDGLPPDSGSGGVSFSPEAALKKAIFEAFERYSQSYFKFNTFKYESHKNLLKNDKALAPSDFCYFSKRQLKSKKFHDFSFDSEDKFYWTDCKDVFTQEKFYIPSQLVYCPYKYLNEKTICLPISTGTALGCSLEEAICGGLFEVIERDAFITSYLLKIPPLEIILKSSSKKIKQYIDLYEKYHLKVRSFILTSDLEVPTILSIIFDNHSTTPPISIGLKTDFDLEKAIIGSIDEAFQLRAWIRRCLILNDFDGKTFTDKVTLKRASFWAKPENTQLLNFIVKTKKQKILSYKEIRNSRSQNYKEKLARIKAMLKKYNLTAYYKCVTHPILQDKGVVVVKTFVPFLHPHYMDENYPYHGGKRLEQLIKKYGRKINSVPHPFL